MDRLSKRTIALSALVILLTNGNVASAQSPTWFGNSADGNWLVGGRIGTLQNGINDYTDAQTLSLMLGYEFRRLIGDNGSASVELELITTFDSGGIRDTNADWDADNIALFLAYRTPGDIYFKAKLGGYSSDVEANVNGRSAGSRSDTSLGYGIGLGFRFRNNANVELEFTGNGSDGVNDLSSISLGAHVNF